MNAKMVITDPKATKNKPIHPEYPFDESIIPLSEKANAICLTKRENFTTTKPNAMTAMAVRIQARKVRSLAR